jgi:hypothetical protein
MGREISLLGFSYNKISAQKKLDFSGKIEINPNINITSIEKHESSLIRQETIKIDFLFGIHYKDLADIDLGGTIILKVDPKTLKETVKGWQDKNLDPEIQTIILNLIMQRASIKAIELEEEMGLPIHIKIPRLELSKKE